MKFDKYDNRKAEAKIYKDMRDIISELKNTPPQAKSRFNSLSNDLNNLYTLAEYYNLYDYPIIENHLSRSTFVLDSDVRYAIFNKNYKQFYDMMNQDFDYHLEVSKLFDLYSEYDFKKTHHKLNHISDYNDLFDYAEDFMQRRDPKLYEIYTKIKKNDHILLTDAETGLGGQCYWFNCNKLSYLALYLSQAIDDASAICHEAAHARQFELMRNNRRNVNFKYLFNEVYSYFTQFTFYQDMIEKNLYVDDVKACFNADMDLLSQYLIDFYDDLVNGNNNIVDFIGNIYYSYGILIALKYFDTYQYDPEQTTYFINQFLENSYRMEPMEVLNSFGLDSEEIKSGKILKKYIKKTKADY